MGPWPISEKISLDDVERTVESYKGEKIVKHPWINPKLSWKLRELPRKCYKVPFKVSSLNSHALETSHVIETQLTGKHSKKPLVYENIKKIQIYYLVHDINAKISKCLFSNIQFSIITSILQKMNFLHNFHEINYARFRFPTKFPTRMVNIREFKNFSLEPVFLANLPFITRTRTPFCRSGVADSWNRVDLIFSTWKLCMLHSIYIWKNIFHITTQRSQIKFCPIDNCVRITNSTSAKEQ